MSQSINGLATELARQEIKISYLGATTRTCWPAMRPRTTVRSPSTRRPATGPGGLPRGFMRTDMVGRRRPGWTRRARSTWTVAVVASARPSWTAEVVTGAGRAGAASARRAGRRGGRDRAGRAGAARCGRFGRRRHRAALLIRGEHRPARDRETPPLSRSTRAPRSAPAGRLPLDSTRAGWSEALSELVSIQEATA